MEPIVNSEPELPNITVGRELVFALVGPVGIAFDPILRHLREALSRVSFTCSEIRLSELLHDISQFKHLNLPGGEYDRIDKHMSAGNEFREKTARGDALAVFAMGAIRDERELLQGAPNTPKDRHAYILRSLKHPSEVSTLRRVYRGRFFVIAIAAPRETLVQLLAARIALSLNEAKASDFYDRAQALIQRDESERGQKYGQNLRDTFPKADLFLSASMPAEQIKQSIIRFIEAIFGYPFHTPRREEYGMFHAHAAGLRSASLGRQVGAAIATDNGDIVAVGTNEVPKPGGGLYWDGDEPDFRDHQLGYDPSDQRKKSALGDLLRRMHDQKWLAPEYKAEDIPELVRLAVGSKESPLKSSHFMSSIDFMRAVHAEAAAIIDAARRGVSVNKCVLYTSTFPCHDCAKHIVAAGISRVVYVEPYAKSLASELYPDSVDINPVVPRSEVVHFQPFIGIAPRQYIDLFQMSGERKDSLTGEVVEWNHQGNPAIPKALTYSYNFYIALETVEWIGFKELLNQKFPSITPGETHA